MNNNKIHPGIYCNKYSYPADFNPLLIQRVLSGDEYYILGRNECAGKLAELLEPAGFVDDFRRERTWRGKPVVRIAELAPEDIVVNCVSSISPLTVGKKLAEAGIKRVVAFSDLATLDHASAFLPDFVREIREDFRRNLQHWLQLEKGWADLESEQVFRQLLAFRLTGDYRFMTGCSVRLREQYFETFLQLSAEEVFVDCGGYDGDTSSEFIQRTGGQFRRIYFFEPCADNMRKARKKLGKDGRILFQEEGVSDYTGRCRFDSAAGSACSISPEGNCTIEVVRLDDRLAEVPTLIKMDLEGQELSALRGVAGCIRRYAPKLAIAAYHRADDLWRIREFVTGIRPDYKVYLRHYTEGWSETVMFFLPDIGKEL